MMNRLTINKDISEMNMLELAHNSCYVKDGNARYRDYDIDIDVRQLSRKLLKEYANGDDAFTCDEDFDEQMLDCLQYGTANIEGIIALLYRNMWAMAELRERLKEYEDLEEQGLVLWLPCKVGDIIYEIHPLTGKITERKINSIVVCNCPDLTIMYKSGYDYSNVQDDFDKTVFLTRAEAEQKLKEMENK